MTLLNRSRILGGLILVAFVILIALPFVFTAGSTAYFIAVLVTLLLILIPAYFLLMIPYAAIKPMNIRVPDNTTTLTRITVFMDLKGQHFEGEIDPNELFIVDLFQAIVNKKDPIETLFRLADMGSKALVRDKQMEDHRLDILGPNINIPG